MGHVGPAGWASLSSAGFDERVELPLSSLLGEGRGPVRGLVLDGRDEADLAVQAAEVERPRRIVAAPFAASSGVRDVAVVDAGSAL
jgi:hypothetical protein